MIGLADDQVLHLEGALVGVERLGVGEEAATLLSTMMPLPPQHLARPGDRFAHPRRVNALASEACWSSSLPCCLDLGEPQHHRLARRHVGEHPGDEILDQLECGDRLAELHALLGVLERGFVGAHLHSGDHPADAGPGQAQHVRGVAERIGLLEAVRFRHAAVGHA